MVNVDPDHVLAKLLLLIELEVVHTFDLKVFTDIWHSSVCSPGSWLGNFTGNNTSIFCVRQDVRNSYDEEAVLKERGQKDVGVWNGY